MECVLSLRVKSYRPVPTSFIFIYYYIIRTVYHLFFTCVWIAGPLGNDPDKVVKGDQPPSSISFCKKLIHKVTFRL